MVKGVAMIDEAQQFWDKVAESGQDTNTVFCCMKLGKAYMSAVSSIGGKCALPSKNEDIYTPAAHAETVLRIYAGIAGFDWRKWYNEYYCERTGLTDKEINGILKAVRKAGYQSAGQEYIGAMVKECRRILAERIDVVNSARAHGND